MFEQGKAKRLSKCIDELERGSRGIESLISDNPEFTDELRIVSNMQAMKKNNQLEIASNKKLRIAKVELLQKLPDRDHFVTNPDQFRFNWRKLKRRLAMNWLIIISTVLSLVSASGVVYASNVALPGENLYQVKMIVEDARLVFASDVKDLELISQSMDTRIQEILTLLEEDQMDDEILDYVVGLYKNHFKLMEQTLEKIQANNPEESIQLRLENEIRLQEQARIMEMVINGEINGERYTNQNQIRQMLETNQQNRKMHVEDDLTGEKPDTSSDQPDAKANGGNQEQNPEIGDEIQFVGQYLQNEKLNFEFQFSRKENTPIYAMIGDKTYPCSNESGKIKCDLSGSPTNGVLDLVNANTNELLFSYEYQHAYQYNWGDENNGNRGIGGGAERDNGKGKE